MKWTEYTSATGQAAPRRILYAEHVCVPVSKTIKERNTKNICYKNFIFQEMTGVKKIVMYTA